MLAAGRRSADFQGSDASLPQRQRRRPQWAQRSAARPQGHGLGRGHPRALPDALARHAAGGNQRVTGGRDHGPAADSAGSRRRACAAGPEIRWRRAFVPSAPPRGSGRHRRLSAASTVLTSRFLPRLPRRVLEGRNLETEKRRNEFRAGESGDLGRLALQELAELIPLERRRRPAHLRPSPRCRSRGGSARAIHEPGGFAAAMCGMPPAFRPRVISFSKAAPSTFCRGAASTEKRGTRRKGKAVPHIEAAKPQATCRFHELSD